MPTSSLSLSDSDIIVALAVFSLSDEVRLVVDVVLRVVREPALLLDEFLLLERVLALPEFLTTVRIAGSRERSLVLREMQLILLEVGLHPPFLLILEPGARHVEIEVIVWLDGWVSPQEDLPVVVHAFKDRSEAFEPQSREVIHMR